MSKQTPASLAFWSSSRRRVFGGYDSQINLNKVVSGWLCGLFGGYDSQINLNKVVSGWLCGMFGGYDSQINLNKDVKGLPQRRRLEGVRGDRCSEGKTRRSTSTKSCVVGSAACVSYGVWGGGKGTRTGNILFLYVEGCRIFCGSCKSQPSASACRTRPL